MKQGLPIAVRKYEEAVSVYFGINGFERNEAKGISILWDCALNGPYASLSLSELKYTDSDTYKARVFLGIREHHMGGDKENDGVINRETAMDQKKKQTFWYGEFVNARDESFPFWSELEQMIVRPERTNIKTDFSETLSGVFTGDERCVHDKDEDSVFALILSKRGLSSLPPEIDLCARLEYLNCSSNSLRELPVELASCSQLRFLRCCANELQSIPQEIFEQCTNLRALTCSGNRLQKLPSQIGKAGRLQLLDCHTNKLTKLPDEVEACSSLTILSVHTNSLSALPDELPSSLKRILCSQNCLTSLPSALCKCLQLQQIACSSNKLTYLPADIGNLKSLEKLSCSWNEISALPAQIGMCTQLRLLDCHKNRLEYLPMELLQCKKLQTLDCALNQLHALPPQLKVQCSKLRILSCDPQAQSNLLVK
eukprot:Nk52_evm36s355 gene=Nk52_evmTU36s355